jgi:hypothetical protein
LSNSWLPTLFFFPTTGRELAKEEEFSNQKPTLSEREHISFFPVIKVALARITIGELRNAFKRRLK